MSNESPTAPQWPSSWIRAALPSAILCCLEDRALHGYAIARTLGARGFGVPKGGSLYPVLARLEQDGAVETRWLEGTSGPGKREYALTAVGRGRLGEERRQWLALAAALNRQEPCPDRNAPAGHVTGEAPTGRNPS